VKLTALVAATSSAIQGTIDQFGDANCFQGPTGDPSLFIAVAQGVADTLCMVP
jgi:hypothetical protein